MMRNDNDHLLNDLLASWYEWSNRHAYASQPQTSAMFSDVPSPRQWDDSGEIADTAAHLTRMRAVEFAINGSKGREGAMPEPHRTAIEFEAKNIAAGCWVWSSPRLPRGEELRVLTLEAKNMLSMRLLTAGVV